jgi:hypothetical protein
MLKTAVWAGSIVNVSAIFDLSEPFFIFCQLRLQLLYRFRVAHRLAVLLP